MNTGGRRRTIVTHSAVSREFPCPFISLLYLRTGCLSGNNECVWVSFQRSYWLGTNKPVNREEKVLK